MTRLLGLLILCAALAAAQPFIYVRGIVDGASLLPSGIAAGAIARGSIFTIYGRNLGPAATAKAESYPVGATLANVAVTVSQGGTTVNALPIFVSAGQVNAIMPSNAPLGSVAVRVRYNNTPSNFIPVRVAENSPGLISARGTGLGPGVIQNFVTQSEQPVNTLQVPARPGQVVTLWATGLGAVADDTVAPTAADLPAGVEIFVGGRAAKKLYAGRAPCCAGTDQIVFQLPDDAPLGCWTPVYVRVAGRAVSNTVTMAITADGSPCQPRTRAGAALVAGGKLGVLAPLRSEIVQPDPVRALTLRSDFLIARFGQEAGGALSFNPLFSLPPAGSCTAYAGSGDWFTADPLFDEDPGVKTLSAAPITVSAGDRQAMFTTPFSPLALGYLGSINPSQSTMDTTMLTGGAAVTIRSAAGADVGAIETAVTLPEDPVWTNRDSLEEIDRSAGFTVNFTGGSGQTIAVVGGSVDLPTNSSAVFVCMAAPGAASVTVPPGVLTNLPPGRGSTLESKAVVFLVAGGASTSFTAGGLDTGVAAPVTIHGKAVTVK